MILRFGIETGKMTELETEVGPWGEYLFNLMPAAFVFEGCGFFSFLVFSFCLGGGFLLLLTFR